MLRNKISSLLFIALLLFSGKLSAQNKLQFGNLDSLFQYADNNSAVIKSGSEQALLAKWTKLASIGNTLNLRSPIAANWTYNSQLPINYIPAEMLGGQPGTVKALSFGQTYVTNYGFTPQIDLINPASWARIKSASINVKLTETTNLVAKKNLYESISAAYFNIVSLQEQIQFLTQNVAAADSIFQITSNKFNEGIVREQDKNNAEINAIALKDKLVQSTSALEQQYNALKLLCDISENTELKITSTNEAQENFIAQETVSSNLLEKQQQLQSDYLKSELRANRLLSFAPSVSLIFNQAWQKNSNASFTDANANKFNTQYFGLKLTVPLPVDVNRLTQNYTSKINFSLSKINSEHASLQNKINNKQLEIDYQKALSTYTTSKKISSLKKDNYEKSLNQYSAGILNTETILLAFTDKINAEVNTINAVSAVRFTKSKIKINATIQ